MKIIKVQILTNRISADLTPILTYAYAYNQKHGITLNFDIKPVDVRGYVSSYVQVRPGTWQWVLAGADTLVSSDASHDVTIFMFDQNEWKSPWWNPFPLTSNVPTSDCILSNGKPFINLGYYAPHSTDTNVMLVHELMHAYTKIAVASGLSVVDQMDTYYLNSTPDAPGGNFSIQWQNLQKWLTPTATMNTQTVTIKRTSDNGVETLGVLTATSSNGSVWSCSTLERPWLNNQHDISCIPKGTYQCSLQHFHSTFMYELAGTAPRTGIFIHPANYVTDLLGCIGLGINPSDINHDGQIDVTSSQVTVATFIAFMDSKPFTLVIE